MRAALEASREDIPSHLRDERKELERALRLSEGEARGRERLGGGKDCGSTLDSLHGREDDFQKVRCATQQECDCGGVTAYDTFAWLGSIG